MNEAAEMLTIEELAAELRTTPAAIYAARHRGDGPIGIRVGRRLLFTRRDIADWLDSRRESGPAWR